MNKMIRRGTTLKNKNGFYAVVDVDVVDGFAIIRKIMRDSKGAIYYGKNTFIGLKQLNDYKVV